MARGLGAALVLAAAGMLGAIIARAYQERPRALRALQSALAMLLTEIVYGATPMPDALDRVARRTPAPVGRFFAAAASYLRAEPGAGTAQAWRRALADPPGWCLTADDEAVLADLGNCLGRSDAADQEKHLRLALAQLQRLQAQAEAERDVHVRLWRYLGAGAGAALVLLLY